MFRLFVKRLFPRTCFRTPKASLLRALLELPAAKGNAEAPVAEKGNAEAPVAEKGNAEAPVAEKASEVPAPPHQEGEGEGEEEEPLADDGQVEPEAPADID